MTTALVLSLAAAAGLVTADAPVAPGDLSPESVRDAIDKGVKFLRATQRADGTWPDYSNHPGGVTALCTLALLSAGVGSDDEAVRRALTKLEGYRPSTTYATALHTLVFCQVDPQKYMLTHIQRNTYWFERTQIKFGPTRGSWSYSEGVDGGAAGGGDGSNAQFALLALHEAERAGAKVAPDTWAAAREYWEGLQKADGSWGYKTMLEGTGSMTCAGIASMIITSDHYRRPHATVNGRQIFCCQQGADDGDSRIARGLQWLSSNFSVVRNPNQQGGAWLMYYLYALERVGRLTNQRFIGKHDWYREGAAFLVAEQDGLSNYWVGTGPVEHEPRIATPMALLFLSKGRRPVLMAKLEHSLAGDWNQHRSDVDNLTRFVERRWQRELTWQVMQVSQSSVEDLLQAPVLFYSGSLNPLPALPAHRQILAQKLRDYLDRGGFLFAEANCGSTAFDQGFRELMSLVFPEPEYRLRPLGPEHPIWRTEAPIPPQYVRPLEGIEAGCRTSVVYAPPDAEIPSLSCLWELSRPGRQERYDPEVQRQIDAGLMLGTNVLAYATNREIKGKEDTLFRTTSGSRPTDKLQRGLLYVASLQHPGGCNAAPRALVNLLERATQDLKIRAYAKERYVALTDEELFDHHLVFMHGRHSFHFTDAERRHLKEYIERGGTLFADAICTSPAFADSFRKEMAAIFADRKLEKIPFDDPLLTPAYGGSDLKSVKRRDPPEIGSINPVIRDTPPDLEGIKFDDRWGVIFSQFDVSCALEKSNPPDCRGYEQASAERIALNVLLYSLQQ
ncbi:MAG: DUF4159 domain-containing protein [Planctomycetota bacterium]